MKWTTDEPKEEGWYWWRYGPGDTDPECVFFVEWAKMIDSGGRETPLANHRGQWCKIPLPSEP